MKKFVLLPIFCLFFTFSIFAQQQRVCAAMESLEYRKQQDPTLEQRMEEIETFTQMKVKEMENNSNKIVGDIITIPVVVRSCIKTVAFLCARIFRRKIRCVQKSNDF